MYHILVVGGAGFIGSHMSKFLAGHGYKITVFDNLSTGHRGSVLHGDLIEADLANIEGLDRLFSERKFDAVMHFASSLLVGESVSDPAKYYRNNVCNAVNLLDVMVRHGVRRLIFSSTAAIFGMPQYVPINEAHPRSPINPYGKSKLMVEQLLEDYDHAYGLKSVCLRYFNAAGADPEGDLGERHDPETHLIPLVLQAASGRRNTITVYGNDYDTPDGTCIRDYIHVWDLCHAHWLALQRLMEKGESGAYNLGNGKGYSVQQVIDVCRRVTGKEFRVGIGARREGDPSVLVADASRARKELGWKPQYPDLEQIVAHAWKWEKKSGREAM
ncbi:MAG: UDP-glucose 4-epimerase GalE [Gammaproteobacteria bacterium]|nr:MAG: UDP-glucose 4-epimerase GalE [Gammaproteobacteria bacterium]